MESPAYSELGDRHDYVRPPPAYVRRHDGELEVCATATTNNRFQSARDSMYARMRLSDVDAASAAGLIVLRRHCRNILMSPRFDAIIGVVILGNALSVGVEQTIRLKGKDTSQMELIESVFLCIYIVELAMRFFAFRLQCLMDHWVVLDIILVAVGVISAWLLEPIFKNTEDFKEQLGPLMVLRSLRLLRLARTLRLLVKFREMWILVRGLLSSGSMMFYTLLLLTTILYIFSCISIEIITNHPMVISETPDEEFKAVVDQYFPDLVTTMLSLSQFITLDNVVYLYTPLVMKDPALVPFFLSMLVVLSIVLMNLVTAVIVNSALEQAMQDKDLLKNAADSKKKKLVKKMREVFFRLDEDNSGEVSRAEIQSISDADREILTELMGSADPVEIFDALDVDGSGDLGIEEFIDGLWQVSISNAPIEVKRMERQVEVMRKQLWSIGQLQASLADAVADIQDSVCGMKHAGAEVVEAQQVMVKLVESDGRDLLVEDKDAGFEKIQNGCTGMSVDTVDTEVKSMAERLFKETEAVSARLRSLLAGSDGAATRARSRTLSCDVDNLGVAAEGTALNAAGISKGSEDSALPLWAKSISRELELLRRHTISEPKANLGGTPNDTGKAAAQRDVVDGSIAGWMRPDDVGSERIVPLCPERIVTQFDARSRSKQSVDKPVITASCDVRSRSKQSRVSSSSPRSPRSPGTAVSWDAIRSRGVKYVDDELPSRTLRRAKTRTMELALRKEKKEKKEDETKEKKEGDSKVTTSRVSSRTQASKDS
eukprot:TRINITY_DN38258_c1_g1_i1.p1 TRINITY_DN38258_c1_g1~~TRINITY_DN38258_c1_g1_i1.p1  ORF type:complete len:772 (-),score=183.14 TRINITY_DN38258_c1_g1_i1:307-2622(-)